MNEASAEDGSESARLEEGAAAVGPAGDRDGLMTVREDDVAAVGVGLRDLADEVDRGVAADDGVELLWHDYELSDPEPAGGEFNWVSWMVGNLDDDGGDGWGVVLLEDVEDVDAAAAAGFGTSGFLDDRDRWVYAEKLLDRAREAGCDGPYWQRVATMVGQYAFGVLKSWIITGKLWRQMTSMRWVVRPNDTQAHLLATDEQARDVLANEIVGAALKRWRKLERRGAGWDSQGKATLRTWFMSLCLREAPNGFRRWRRPQQWRDKEHLDATSEGAGFERYASPLFYRPDRVTVSVVELERVLAQLKPTTQELKVLELRALGYELLEIAALVEMRRDEVRNMLRRLRYRAARAAERDPT